MTTEIYACVSCGSVFMPGTGDDNIIEASEGTPFADTPYRAFRDGDCPACATRKPDMRYVGAVLAPGKS